MIDDIVGVGEVGIIVNIGAGIGLFWGFWGGLNNVKRPKPEIRHVSF